MKKERNRYNVVNFMDKSLTWGSESPLPDDAEYPHAKEPSLGKKRSLAGMKFRQGQLGQQIL
jgi:hypothetical protein